MADRRELLVALTTGLGVAVAGCTSDTGGTGESSPTDESTPTQTESGTASPTPTDEPTPTPTESGTATESQAVVSIPGLSFDPLRLSVDPGTTVTWVNESSSSHDVVSAQFHTKAVDWSFESETFSGGEQVSYTFGSEGVYEYRCSIHGEGSMSAAVLVGDVTLDATLPSEEDDGGYY